MLKIDFLVSREGVESGFHEVRDLFERMTQSAMHGEFTVDDMKKMALDGQLLIGIIRDGERPVMGLALEFITFPRYKVMNVVALAGAGLKAAMRDIWPLLTEFARQSGARHIQASCHPGMAKLLSRHGFEETYHVVRARL